MTIDWKKRKLKEGDISLSAVHPAMDPSCRGSIAIPWLSFFGEATDTGISFDDENIKFIVNGVHVSPVEWEDRVTGRGLLRADEAAALVDAFCGVIKVRGDAYLGKAPELEEEPLTWKFDTKMKLTPAGERVRKVRKAIRESFDLSKPLPEVEALRDALDLERLKHETGIGIYPATLESTLAPAHVDFRVNVKNVGGRSVPRAQVDVETASGKSIAYGCTDDHGVFKCPDGVPMGWLFIVVHAVGFEMMHTKVEVNGDADSSVDCFLKESRVPHA